jgi:hypothetical protein
LGADSGDGEGSSENEGDGELDHIERLL